MGESTNPRATLRFDRRVQLEFRGATITSDAGLLACRELDDALGLTETANECLQESRGGRNVQHRLVSNARNYRPLRQVIDHPVRRNGDHCCRSDVRSSNGVQGGVESGDSRSGASLAVGHQPARYINWYGAVSRDSSQVHRCGRGGGAGPGRSCSE